MVHRREKRKKRRARRRRVVRRVVAKVKKVVKKVITKRAVVRAKVKKVVRRVVAPKRPPRRPPTRPPIARPPTRPPTRPRVPTIIRPPTVVRRIIEKRIVRRPPRVRPPIIRPPRRPPRRIIREKVIPFVKRVREKIRIKPPTIEREIIKPPRVTTRVPIIPPKKFGIDYQKATGAKTFTIAIPVGREAGKLKVQDFNFIFKDGKLVKTTPKSSILLTDAQYVERDERRREKFPEFTLGEVKLFPIKKPPRKKGVVAPPTFKEKIKGIIIKKIEERKIKVSKGLDIITGGVLIKRRLNKRQEKLNEEIKKFNKKFGNKELSESTFEKAQAEKDKLDKRLSTLEKERETFEKSLPPAVKAVRAPFRFLAGSYKWQKKALKKGEKQKAKEEKTRVGKWLKTKSGNNLPFGLQEAHELINNPRSAKSMKIIKGKKFNPWLANYWVASKIVKIPAINKFAKEMYKKYPEQYSLATGVALDIGVPIFTIGQLGAFFSPALEVGAAKKGKGQVQVQKKKVTKKAAKKGKELIDKIRRDLVKRKRGKEQMEYLNKLFKKINKNDPKEVKDFQNLVQRLYEEGTFKGIPIDLTGKPLPPSKSLAKAGDLKKLKTVQGSLQKLRTIKRVTTSPQKLKIINAKIKKLKAIEKIIQTKQVVGELEGIIDIAGFVPRMKGISISFGLGGVRETAFLKESSFFNFEKQKEKLKEKEKQKFITKTLTTQKERLKTLQKVIQQTEQLQETTQTQTQTTTQQLNTILISNHLRKLKKLGGGIGIFIRKLEEIKLKKIIKLPKRKRVRKKKPKKRIGYRAHVKSKGKFKKVSKPLSKTKAKDRGAYVTDRTVSATFKVKSVGKRKKLGKLPKKQRGYFKRKRKKFRSFKIVKGKRVKLKNKFIEKRKARIDTRGEKKGLTVAKLLRQERKRKKPFRKKVVRRSSFKKRIIKRRPIKRRVMKKRRSFRKRILIRKPIKRKPFRKRIIKKRIIRKPFRRKPMKRKVIKKRKVRKRVVKRFTKRKMIKKFKKRKR